MGGAGNQSPPSLWWSFMYLKTVAYLSFRFSSSGMCSACSFNLFFKWVIFSGVSLLLSFGLLPPLLKLSEQLYSWFTLKTSHLSVLTWWFDLVFSHQYGTYFRFWCIINSLICISSELIPTCLFPYLQLILPKPVSLLVLWFVIIPWNLIHLASPFQTLSPWLNKYTVYFITPRMDGHLSNLTQCSQCSLQLDSKPLVTTTWLHFSKVFWCPSYHRFILTVFQWPVMQDCVNALLTWLKFSDVAFDGEDKNCSLGRIWTLCKGY